jgi:glutaredoxin 3
VINEQTPYKTAEIIRDTWPGIFRPPLDKSLNTSYNTKGNSELAMDIQIYKKPGCGYCVKIDELMTRVGIEAQVIMIGKDVTLDEFRTNYPNATGVPYVIIDGEEIGGLVETVKYFVEKGIVTSKK